MARFYRYEVHGFGDFPWDMLRYDRVWPLTEPEPSRYEATSKGRRTVQVEGARCTPARWDSFGWSVVDADNAIWGVAGS
jgi:hypothetical protein